MPCNLNFNQCNSFSNFPRPIFNCYQNLIALFNQSGTTIINPVIEGASILTEINTTQSVIAGQNVLPSPIFSQGSAITLSGDTFTLINGRYLIYYNLSGIISPNGTSSFGIFLNDFLLPSSSSAMSGTVGTSATLSGSAFVEITSPSGSITIKNTNNQGQTINNGSITIQKII